MPLRYPWRRDNHDRDLDVGAGYHLNQASPLLHEVSFGGTATARWGASCQQPLSEHPTAPTDLRSHHSP